DEYTLATRQPAALQGDPVQDGRTATARAGGGRAGTGAHSTGTAAGHAQREGGRTCDRRQDAAVAATAISAGTEDPGWFGGAELVARATLKSTPQRWPLEVARQPIGKRFKYSARAVAYQAVTTELERKHGNQPASHARLRAAHRAVHGSPGSCAPAFPAGSPSGREPAARTDARSPACHA